MRFAQSAAQFNSGRSWLTHNVRIWALRFRAMFSPILLLCSLAIASSIGGPSAPLVDLQPPEGTTVDRFDEQFPEARFLDEEEFRHVVVGRRFHYRPVESDLIIHGPTEFFSSDGGYSYGHRVTYSGTWSVEAGKVLLDVEGLSFLRLGKERVFFSYRERLFTAAACDAGSVTEMIIAH